MIKVFIVDRLNHIGEIPSSRTATCPVGRVRNSSITVHARGKCNFLESIVIRTRIYITPPVERRNRKEEGSCYRDRNENCSLEITHSPISWPKERQRTLLEIDLKL